MKARTRELIVRLIAILIIILLIVSIFAVLLLSVK
jgi:hypothetical protein